MMRKGFTLIEISVVVAIFAIMLGLVLANFRTGKLNTELRQAALRLVDDIRFAQNMTLVGTTYPTCALVSAGGVKEYWEDCTTIGSQVGCSSGSTCEATVMPGGYGLYFDYLYNTQYATFGDFGDAKRSNVTGTPVQYRSGVGGDRIVNMTQLPAGVVIEDIKITAQFDQPTDIAAGRCLAKGTSVDNFFQLGNPYGTISNPHAYGTYDGGEISFTFTQPKARLYTQLHGVNWTGDPYGTSKLPCPDYLVTILLKQTRTGACRDVTINGATNGIEEKINATCTI